MIPLLFNLHNTARNVGFLPESIQLLPNDGNATDPLSEITRGINM